MRVVELMVNALAPGDLLVDDFDEGALADLTVDADNPVSALVREDRAFGGATPRKGGVAPGEGSPNSSGPAFAPAAQPSRAIDQPIGDRAAAAKAAEGAASAPSAGSGDAAAPIKGSYPQPAGRPTQAGPEGIFFDFNQGCRVLLPPREHGTWRARLRDLDTGNILFETESKGALIRSSKRWYVRFSIEVWSVEEGRAEPRPVLRHEYDATEREVLIQFPVGTLGDSIAWFSYAARFGARHPGCRVTCAMSPAIIALLRDAYPDIRFVAPEDVAARRSPIALTPPIRSACSSPTSPANLSTDRFPFRRPAPHGGVHPRRRSRGRGAAPGFARRQPADRRALCVIAVQATSGAKYWNNPHGWREVVAFLKARGYRVICIDQKPAHGHGLMWTHIPHGVEDETGAPAGRAGPLAQARFAFRRPVERSFLARLGGGLPVVMISGFSHPTTEFTTPYRVINWHTCNSCWNDPKHNFDHKDFLWCPRHANTPRQFECTRLITAAQVTRVIQTIPGFGAHRAMK